MSKHLPEKLPNIGLLYLDHVLRFFDRSNFQHWPDKIETVIYHWGKDKQRFINEVRDKKIDVLIGNIPATAYETFREIARELPQVEFIPSLDSQFSNKSKENVTHFCQKYDLAAPKTHIFYDQQQADAYLASTHYPKIIKKSYGPSNYGGYYVHKVDDYRQASSLLTTKRYYPVYVQDFIEMTADIRVMLIGHKPVCAFWRRPPDGGWLTNTSQGGTMDYMNVPSGALDLAVLSSKAAKAQYWACDIAVGKDGGYSILECATAFAAFPYIRDWIGQYLNWTLSKKRFSEPYFPPHNWEELGKIDSSLLRTMRNITFSPTPIMPVNDCGDTFLEMDLTDYPLVDIASVRSEEWPSEVWNRQDNERRLLVKAEETVEPAEPQSSLSTEEGMNLTSRNLPELSEHHLYHFFEGVKGIGKKLAENIVNTLGIIGVTEALVYDPQKLTQVKHVKDKKLSLITEHWLEFSKSL